MRPEFSRTCSRSVARFGGTLIGVAVAPTAAQPARRPADDGRRYAVTVLGQYADRAGASKTYAPPCSPPGSPRVARQQAPETARREPVRHRGSHGPPPGTPSTRSAGSRRCLRPTFRWARPTRCRVRRS
ncbi:hypothetical protein PUR32_26615 [Streptomyces sp. BE133]|nr:hypothetical protein [Streptomyces sp. BE133]